MALGIGANTAIFSLVDTVLLRPLAGARTVAAWSSSTARCRMAPTSRSSRILNYKDYRDRKPSSPDMLAYRFVVASLSHNGVNERVWGYLVSGNYFDVLGVKPMLGRAFLPEEDQTPDSHPVVVLSYGCWQKRFGSDPSIVGRDGFVQQSSVHGRRRRAERFCRHRGRVCAGNVGADDDGETKSSRAAPGSSNATATISLSSAVSNPA